MNQRKFSKDGKIPWKKEIRIKSWGMLNYKWKKEIRNLKLKRKESEKQGENQDCAVPRGKSQLERRGVFALVKSQIS